MRCYDTSGYSLLVFTLERRKGELEFVLKAQHRLTEFDQILFFLNRYLPFFDTFLSLHRASASCRVQGSD